MIAAILFSLLQITPSQEAHLQAGLVDIRRLDEELRDIKDNRSLLRAGSAAAKDEIRSLKLRYPSIVLNDGAGAEGIYDALRKVRDTKSNELRPLAAEKLRVAENDTCKAAENLQRMRTKLEAGDGYQRMSLSERLEWRRAMDALAPDSKCSIQ